MIYNSLVQVKHNVSKAWANIDVLLKQRHDEMPKLVEVCKQYRQFEQDTLQKVIEARSRVFAAQPVAEHPRARSGRNRAARRASATCSRWPRPIPISRPTRSSCKLQTRITALENAIADRREFYNESVNINNVRIEQFPDVIVAGMFHFPPRQLLEFQDAEKADVDVKQLFAA